MPHPVIDPTCVLFIFMSVLFFIVDRIAVVLRLFDLDEDNFYFDVDRTSVVLLVLVTLSAHYPEGPNVYWPRFFRESFDDTARIAQLVPELRNRGGAE